MKSPTRSPSNNRATRTVRVRIAVRVSSVGEYIAEGFSHFTGGKHAADSDVLEALDMDFDALDSDDIVHIVWVEADVPLPPESVTVGGSIVP